LISFQPAAVLAGIIHFMPCAQVQQIVLSQHTTPLDPSLPAPALPTRPSWPTVYRAGNRGEYNIPASLHRSQEQSQGWRSGFRLAKIFGEAVE